MAQLVDTQGHQARTSPATPRFAHNPALDGIRGAAVLVVMLYHTELLTGGWIGVEAFFVLSGYLITSLLVIEIDTSGKVDLVAFWRRRARRLLPGLFMVLAVVAVFTRWIADPTSYASIRRDVWGALTYSSNWVSIYGGGGYWQRFSAPSPLHHIWSLAVEEQFYIVYPALAIVLLRRRWRYFALPALAAVALGWQMWMTFHADLDRYYLGTDTRAFGILLGASIALITSDRIKLLARWLAVPALVYLAFAAWALDGTADSTFQGPFQLVTLASGILILGVSTIGSGIAGQAFSMGWLTKVGAWSYGIYLVHWPIAEVLRQRYELSPWPVTVVVVPLSLAIAAVSFRLVESPLRRRGIAAFRHSFVPLAGAAAFSVLAVAATVVGARTPLSSADVADVAAPVVDPGAGGPAATLPPLGRVGVTPRPADRPYRVMVVGDSVGASMKEPLDALADRVGMEVFSRAAPSCSYDRERTTNGTFTEEQSCVDIVDGWAADVDAFRPDVVLFMYGSWSGWALDGTFRTQCDPVMAAHVRDLYQLAVDDLGARGAPLYFIAPAYWRSNGEGQEADTAYDCLRDVMRGFVDSQPGRTAYIDVHSVLCDGANCTATADGEPVRADGLHYSGPGAESIIVDILRQAIEPPADGWPRTPAIECCSRP